MKEYKYPDEGDKLTYLFINTKSDEDYWAESEKNILNIMLESIKNLPKEPRLLDLGCGMGRLFSVFEPYVESITGVDPDENRLEEAIKEANRIDAEKIKTIKGDISLVENNNYDVVLISHIFQHIPIKDIECIVQKSRKMIPSGGLLCTTTTFSGTGKDVYTIEYLKNGKRVLEEVSEKVFNKNISNPGILPVREISLNTITKILGKNGFILEKMAGYHFYKTNSKETLSVEYDNKMNALGNIQNAKDIMCIFRKET